MPATASKGGLLNINKPIHLTSFQVVKKVRKILGEKRVGHCGTLDPLASGVLLVLFGLATSQAENFVSSEKEYRCVMQFGIRTDTGDLDGRIIESADFVFPKKEEIERAFIAFTGEIEQIPPMFSAVKVGGQRLYKYARKGIEIKRAPRKVWIASLEFLSSNSPYLEFRAVCSKGTYIRVLAEDIGKFLGIPATVYSLVRERIGSFSIDQSLSWNDLSGMDRDRLIKHSHTIL